MGSIDMNWLDRVKASRHGTLAHDPIGPELAINALQVQLIERYCNSKDPRYIDLQKRLQNVVNANDPLDAMPNLVLPSRLCPASRLSQRKPNIESSASGTPNTTGTRFQ